MKFCSALRNHKKLVNAYSGMVSSIKVFGYSVDKFSSDVRYALESPSRSKSSESVIVVTSVRKNPTVANTTKRVR